MSGSETGMMAAREPFSAAVQQNHNQMPSQPSMHNMRLSFSADGTAIYKPIAATSPTYQPGPASGGESPAVPQPQGGETIKKKRGRPRKYGPDGTMGLTLITSSPPPTAGTQPGAPGFSLLAPTPAGSATATATSPTTMKKRGRPPGSTNKKHLVEALGAPGTGFTPHVITVKAGEDISSKIMSFSQHGPRAVCILSANGAISNVTLRQPATSGGTVTYEGRFEILSLSGSFLLSEAGGQRSRTGGLSVSLSGPDGRVLGGGIAGLLTAASPVQVVVGSFMADGQKEPKLVQQTDVLSAAQNHTSASLPAAASSPPSRGTFSESSGGGGSPLNQSIGNNNPQAMSNLPWK